MAHDPASKTEVRAGYLSGLALEGAAAAANIPYETARKWKKAAAAEGDDWDMLRSAQLLAGGGFEEVMRRVLSATIRQAEATLTAAASNPDIEPAEQTKMLGALADTFSKLVSASRKLMPETDELAIKLGVLKQFAEFVRERFPDAAGGLAEALEAFGAEVARG
jgi:hypothetical protein